MQLVSSGTSPYVRKVRVMIRETGQQDAIKEINVANTPFEPAPEALAANPLGRIPALLRNDGPAIYDSRVITRYLDARLQAGLYPESRIWDVLTLEATADGILDSSVGMAYEARFKGTDGKNGEWIEAQWIKVARALSALDTRWLNHLNGQLDMSHIAVACALSYLDFRHDARNWRAGHDGLAAWFSTFDARDSMQKTGPALSI